jgi:hypothetical protein
MTTPPADLRAAIARDMAPARPLLAPAVRALMLAPVALATIVAVPLMNFFRPDMADVGVMKIWGLSLLEAAAGVVIVGLGLRESIPGRALSRAAVAGAVAAGLALPAAVFLLTAERFDVGVPPQALAAVSAVCFRTAGTAAIPALIASTVLVARAFPLRPGVAGALYGLGCGVIADAGLRLYCDFTIPVHVITAHGGAVVAAMFAGSVAARIAPRA